MAFAKADLSSMEISTAFSCSKTSARLSSVCVATFTRAEWALVLVAVLLEYAGTAGAMDGKGVAPVFIVWDFCC